jgi:hypothetical protein
MKIVPPDPVTPASARNKKYGQFDEKCFEYSLASLRPIITQILQN